MAKRVLLCDDEIPILRAAEFKLRRGGYEVDIASDGEEAWEIICARPPDVLVTDCQMPRLDGPGLIRRVRDNPATHDLPILMLTARGFDLSPDELAGKWGVAAVLAKPFSPRELLQVINAVVCEQPAPGAIAVNLPTEIFGNVVVLHTPQELGADQAGGFEAFAGTLERANAVLDLDGTETLDSRGLTALLNVHDKLRERGGDVKIAVSNPTNRKILEITRLDRQLEVFDSVVDAVRSFH